VRRSLLVRVRAEARHHAGTVALGLVLACALAPAATRLRARTARTASRADWVALLPAARVGRLRAALLVDARDCPATLGIVELFARPELAGAIDGVSLLVRDRLDSLARYADARLTGAVQVAVVAVPARLRRDLDALGRGPRLLLVDAAGRVVWATRADAAATDAPSFVPTLVHVAEHHLTTELANANAARIARDTGRR
jgi:hypothetical protein